MENNIQSVLLRCVDDKKGEVTGRTETDGVTSG